MSDSLQFPPLELGTWGPTRDTIHIYSRLAGKIRQALTPPLEKWWHISLHVNEAGLTTTDIPMPTGTASFHLQLNLTDHVLAITLPDNAQQTIPLQNQTPHSLMKVVLLTLNGAGIQPEIDQSIFASTKVGVYIPQQATTFLSALKSVNAVFQQVKATLPGKSSPVQLWPHHFDLSFEWFSGREAQVPAGEEGGDEQIGFGFSTGDESVAEAYFYANPWPFPEVITTTSLPEGASWYTQSWKGGLLRYSTLSSATDPVATLSTYLTAMHHEGTALMK